MKGILTTFREGFVAPGEIIVYKGLSRDGDSWVDPSIGEMVSLDSEITSTVKTQVYGHEFRVYGIFSYTTTARYGAGGFFKAIIPGGSRFWLSTNLMGIVSEKLFVTSEIVRSVEYTDLSSLYLPYCLDLLTYDGWRVSWSPEVNLKDVRGIFVYDSQAIGIETYESEFSSLPFPLKSLKRKAKAEKDLDGLGKTVYLRENNPDLEILKKLPDDSYIPALGELSRALENLTLINLTRNSLCYFGVIGDDWFWSCSPYSDNRMWTVKPGLECWFDRSYSYIDNNRVLPFII